MNAQQARRFLDRIVGYKVSPFLWTSLERGLSAGRVQSVALLLVCQREEEIAKFVVKEWWSLDAIFFKDSQDDSFSARLFRIDNEKFDIDNQKLADEYVKEAKAGDYIVSDVVKKAKKKSPPKPFITSTLQQKASYRLNFPAAKTMSVAQQLYEGIDVGQGPQGLISYMRTDSIRISDEARQACHQYIENHYGEKYVGKASVKPVKKKKTDVKVQDAHEAIRPTDVTLSPDKIKSHLDSQQLGLYTMIWEQFVRSQMAVAQLQETAIFIESGRFTFKATGTIVEFDGHLKLQGEASSIEQEDKKKKDVVNEEKESDKRLPALEKGDAVQLHELVGVQHFTKPPARYSDATLIKALEEYGIGRPSTYAPTIKTLLQREYVEHIKKRFHPTEKGVRLNQFLSENFSDLFNVNFTAKMEGDLDEIASGKVLWKTILSNFYASLEKKLSQAKELVDQKRNTVEKTDRTCDLCKASVVIRNGRYGKYYACEKYPSDCKFTQNLEDTDESVEEKCEKCGSDMRIRRGRFGKFLACSGYPKCKNARSIVEKSGQTCPEDGCSGELIKKRNKKGNAFWGCSAYPDCKYITNELSQEQTEEEVTK